MFAGICLDKLCIFIYRFIKKLWKNLLFPFFLRFLRTKTHLREKSSRENCLYCV